MGTYAVYKVWVGISLKNEAPYDKGHPFLQNIMASSNPIQRDGLSFESIDMHGETVGIGVEIFTLNWNTEIDKKNAYNTDISEEARETLKKVASIFEKIKIFTPVRIYHHVDLGG